MRKNILYLLLTILSLSCSFLHDNLSDGIINEPFNQESDYIIFISEGSTFSPVIVVSEDPVIEWIWDDGTTSLESSPTKDYMSAGTRINKLRVDPWSSLVRINIGYDGGDGGSSEIEYVDNQNISAVENLDIVAPYLKQWCSSYNSIQELDFSNFVSLNTIECFKSTTLNYANLTNTPELKRACFEDCNLLSLDLSDCEKLEDLRGALNSYTTVDFGSIGSDVWHICIRDNPQITENLFTDMTNFSKIEELFIWNDSQNGDLVIPSTGIERTVNFQIYQNNFQRVDLRGSLQNSSKNGVINLKNNNIYEIYIDGCSQITSLDLRNNALSSSQVDYVLALIDSFGRSNGTLYLTDNAPPSSGSSSIILSLETKGWVVNVD